ncbi:Complex 1 LYR protein domain [Fusarium oxysporum f. sp. vasinfectum]|nr:Complex 1 LYR protein domain [Fusarium oxysporum f. sp. vasinfectum]
MSNTDRIVSSSFKEVEFWLSTALFSAGQKKIADPTTRAESRKYARDEFERRRNVTDASHVRYLLSVGKTEWEGMERYIDGM